MAHPEPSHRGLPASRANKDHLKELATTFERDPSKAVLAYDVTSERCECCRAKATVSSFELGGEEHAHSRSFALHLDLPTQLLGHDTAPTPGEHFLAALGSCLCLAFVHRAECRGLSAEHATCVVRGEVDLRGCFDLADVPVTFTRITATFRVPEGAPLEELEAVAHEAAQHSVIARALRDDIGLTVSVEVRDDKGKEERSDTIPASQDDRWRLEEEQRRAGLEASESEKPQ